MSRRGLVRVLTCYEQDGGEYLGERVLALGIGELRALFDAPADDEMMGVHPVGERQAEALRDALEIDIDLEAYAWFVEAYEVDAD